MNELKKFDLQTYNTVQFFSSVSGILFHSVSCESNHRNLHCGLCKLNCTYIYDLLINRLPESDYNIFFCPAGLCYIIHPLHEDKFLISEPIFCGSPHNEAFKKMQLQYFEHTAPNVCSFCVCMPPGKLYRLAKLFSHLLKVDPITLPFNKTRNVLCDAIIKENINNVKEIIEATLENILAKTGLNFHKTKQLCIEMIMMLHELILEFSDKGLDAQENHFQFSVLSQASSIGDLKQCLLNISEDFAFLVFNATTLKQNDTIIRATEIIEENFSKKLNQNIVAGAVYLSPSYFSKLFKEITGLTFSQYLNQVRINKAKDLLVSPFIPIDSIYKAVGFENRSYFGKMFRRITGVTPKTYRDAYRKKQV